ncbi:MAG: ABC transporter substrate-binding protein [Gammaproteobacteria bacterium]|jgi:phospholipid transport system substrate-binding protein|nr:ABC transporter substrate-binding protein [Gammaproteobacteria bacterium]MBT3859922.1 ABC transporter substrate-binding protein [Gammaproteobacteria bacterium]MBT3986384.1 ABC transporter substrate-binding protein [Gammaproteobacteria bacterium]MBT4255023.1 ABC transporter substrate-binding protein [Gammaproteobacteria bacterium]MBT4582944.1 ABC transporter substrate-binding protein [Gammaproteobacteria bacterium]
MNLLKKYVLLFVMASFLPSAMAQQMTAVETAEKGVETLLATVAESKNLFLSDRDQYFSNVEGVLNTFVDFNEVAAVVMSRHAGSASDAQKQRFADILKTTLTRFYGAALVSYNDEELVFLPAGNPNADPRADTVVSMELRGADTNLKLQYQMFLNADEEWKLKNLSLVGINLGRQYNTQFTALMSQHNNDIDLVLNNWK